MVNCCLADATCDEQDTRIIEAGVKVLRMGRKKTAGHQNCAVFHKRGDSQPDGSLLEGWGHQEESILVLGGIAAVVSVRPTRPPRPRSPSFPGGLSFLTRKVNSP